MFRRQPVAGLALAVLLTSLGCFAPSAHASSLSTGPCFPGAAGRACQFQMATVTQLVDGDTVDVHLDGAPRGQRKGIRFRAIQAMEMHLWGHPGTRQRECNAAEATTRVARLIRRAHNRVRLSTQVPGTDGTGRLVRWVAVRDGAGWRDLGETLIREGHALWMDNTTDVAWNRRYNLAEQLAVRDNRNLWDRTHCGAGPQQQVPLRVLVESDPVGPETAAGEWVKVQNLSPTDTLHLGRWWVRDAMLRRFTFPDGTDLAPGATLTLHVGAGQASPGELFWGLPRPIFENAYGTPGRDLGDGAYLFDPQGDLRGWLVYPCLVDCTDPLAGAVTVQAYPRAPEHVVVRNVSNAAVDLYGYALSVPGSAYAFGQPTVLAPGAALNVTVQGDPRRDTASTHAMGVDGYKLPDAGGAVRLVTFSYIVVACDAWGSGRCS